MVGTATNGTNGRTRQGFCLVNNGGYVMSPISAPRSAPPSNAGSECGNNNGNNVFEFTREDVEALLREKPKRKDKFNLKEKCDVLTEYIKKLKLCIKWFQELEASYVYEQESLQSKLEKAELRCCETEFQLKIKEEELGSIIQELRKDFASLRDKFEQEECDKLEAVDSLSKEKQARFDIERSQKTMSDELSRAQRELTSASQKIASLNDMYKRLQDYIASLQQYNSKLHTDLSTVEDDLKRIEKEKAGMTENLSMLKGQLTMCKTSHDEAVKQRDILVNEAANLKMDLRKVKEDHESLVLEVDNLSAEVIKYKDLAESSCSELNNMATRTNELEEKCDSQGNEIRTLKDQLMIAQDNLQVSDISVLETKTEFEEQKRLILELQTRLADAEFKVIEGDALRKKLHNTILELKGNIRVFCRVRPLLPDENSCGDAKVISYPTSMEALGRGIELSQSGQKHPFTFDKVFSAESSQDNVFEEISQLVQSALDGYKVCIFAYGQTGSGKTYTMMGKPGQFDQKGLIPRTLEQIFQTRQALISQGWKYEMQVSMLEIYNETIRDLLSTNRQSQDSVRSENGSNGKQFMIKHDANGNTHVSDLTIMDVRSAREVAYLLDRAAQTRAVGKTQMNERSSRSHFVFTLRISGFNESTEQQVQGVLNLIDLAGSERLSKSGSTGDRLKETQAINKSLSALSDVIFSLAKKEDHVPFRNSKLTYLLQPCLGGDSKTLMVVNISPEPASSGESLCSLRFASRVNACEIGVARRQTHARSSDSRLSYG